VSIDGLFMTHDPNPHQFKDGRYFIDSYLVSHVFDPVLRPNTSTSGVQIDSIYLQQIVPKGTSGEEKSATEKVLYATVQGNHLLFKQRKGSSTIPSKALLVNITCKRDDARNGPYGCLIRLGAQADPTRDRTHGESFTHYLNDCSASLFRIYFAQILLRDAPQAAVVSTTEIVASAFATTNPTLVVTLFLPSSKLEDGTIFAQVASSLKEAVQIFNSQVAKQN
jgi:hypothetical protein